MMGFSVVSLAAQRRHWHCSLVPSDGSFPGLGHCPRRHAVISTLSDTRRDLPQTPRVLSLCAGLSSVPPDPEFCLFGSGSGFPLPASWSRNPLNGRAASVSSSSLWNLCPSLPDVRCLHGYHFSHFVRFFFFSSRTVVSDGNINLVPVTGSWMEVEILRQFLEAEGRKLRAQT